MIYTFRYPGNKYKYLQQIYEHIHNAIKLSNVNTLVEPFGGSGCVSINFGKLFMHGAILNDIDTNIINVHNSLSTVNYDEFNKFIISHKLNSISLCNKESYYNFRDTCNRLYHNKDAAKFGLGCYFLIGSCINSLVRFGPNGFNQSYGNRDFSTRMNQIYHSNLKNHYKHIKLSNEDYRNIFDIYDSDTTLMFIDPPYSNMNDVYHNNFDKFDKNEFLERIVNMNSKIIYTDSYNANEWQKLKMNGWNRYYIRHINAVKPHKTKENNTKHIEVLYTNF